LSEPWWPELEEFFYIIAMKLSYTYWQNDGFYIGHLNEYPEYDTQGKSLAELEAMLKSLYEDLPIDS